MTKSKDIGNYLDELFPNPKCELNYNSDYELLIAIMLSAQTTDKRVNECTKELFTKYDTLEKLSTVSVESLEKYLRPLGSWRKKKYLSKRNSKIISGKI